MAETISTKYGSVYTNTPCGRTIRNAEEALGPLTAGQKVDLLLDNHMEIANSDESRELVRLVTVTAVEPSEGI